MISAYSFIMSVLLFNLALALVYMLRRKKDFIASYGIQTLIIITILGLIRLISPVDWEPAYIVRSYKVIPAIQGVLNYPLVGDGMSLGRALITLWVVVALVFVLRDAALIIRFKIQRSRYAVCEHPQITKVAEELGIEKRIVITSCVGMPFVAGHFRQNIYVPPLELSDEDWKYVLLHEKQHIAAHDQHIKLLFVLLRALFWWNPISHLFVGELDAVLELRCDNAVTARLDEAGSLAYFSALLNAIKQMLPQDARVISAASALIGGVSESKANIMQRFEVYRNSNKRRSRRARGAIYVLVFLVFVASYFVIVQPAYFPPESEIDGIHEVNDVSAFILYDGEKYWLYIDDEQFMELDESELDIPPHDTMPVFYGGN